MPTYVYLCDNGHQFERILRVAEYQDPQACECGADSKQQITCPTVFVSQDIAYHSPIDGKPILSKKARREDLARSGCVEYDPSMVEWQKKRHAREDAAIDKKVDQIVEAEIDAMPSHKREKLANEFDRGMDIEVSRI